MEPTLSMNQYSLVSNLMSLTIATMGASALFFFLSRQLVSQKYRLALNVSGLVVAIACYHYFKIFESFTAAYTVASSHEEMAPLEIHGLARYVR